MAEQRIWPAGEHRREAFGVPGQTGVAHRVDTTVEAMKPAGLGGAIDRATGITEEGCQLTD